jgi:hypothetical protein
VPDPAGDWGPVRTRKVTRDNRKRIAIRGWGSGGFAAKPAEDRAAGGADEEGSIWITGFARSMAGR